ncbi:MAG: GGDEF domain-containing protein [Synechococcaceae cyanobacterium]|nr:GGDEF domain-containing protein [Synechococcaceae cyanobacterium]
MALVVSEQGRVLAASNNALVGLPIDRVLQLPDQRPLQALFRNCPPPGSLTACLRQDSRLFLGPLPWIGGSMVLSMRQYPLAVEGMAGFVDRGSLITIHDAQEAGLEALSLSLSAFLASLLPLMLSYAGLMLRLRSRLIPELLALAELDALSGVYNRRAFLETAEALLRQAAAAGLPMALAVIDVDRFKGINDSRGHDAGDRVIERVAELLRTAVRGADLVGRLGGDEFVILLQLSGEAATATLGRILETVRRTPIAVHDGQALQVTLSVGVATREGEARTTLADLLAAADAALYVAKDRGRDQVVNLELEAQQSSMQTWRPGTWSIHSP